MESLAYFAKLVDPGVREHFNDPYKQLEPKINEIFNVMTQEDYNEEHYNFTGLGSLAPIGEGESYPEGRRLQAYGTTYSHQKYGELVGVSYELGLFDKSKGKSVMKVSESQAKQVVRSIEFQSSAVFNNSQDTAFTSLGDGKPLGSSDHTSPSGLASQVNASTNGILLTDANVDVAQTIIEETLDGRGQPISQFANRLVVPRKLKRKGMKIVHSTNESGSNKNDINTLNPANKSISTYDGMTLPYVTCWNYLGAYLGGSDTRWFLLSDQHRINWLWASKPAIGDKNDSIGYRNDMVYWKVRYVASTGWDGWEGFFVSAGTGAAYAS